MRTDPEQKDVVIIGGGPAGLSAALMLGRARKQVLLCNGGTPRNSAAEGIHGFVTRDGIPPKELRRIAHEQLEPYGVDILLDTRVTAVERLDPGFRVVLSGRRGVQARRVLLATGMVGVHAAGDLTTRRQGASMAAGAGTMAGAMMNHALNMEYAAAGLWPEG